MPNIPNILYIKIAEGKKEEQVLTLDFGEDANPSLDDIVTKFNDALKDKGLLKKGFAVDFDIRIDTLHQNLKGPSRGWVGEDPSYNSLHTDHPDDFPESIFDIKNNKLSFAPPRAFVNMHHVKKDLVLPAVFIEAPLSKVLDSDDKQASVGNDPKDDFIQAHTQLLSDQRKKWFGSLRRTRIDPELTSLEDIVRHVKFSSSENRSKKVFKQLGWMDKKGELTDKAPSVIRDLYNKVMEKNADKESVRQKFVDQHTWLMSKEKRDFYGFFSKMLKTTIRQDTSLEEIVSHVKESGLIDNRSKQVFKQLGWMSKDGKLTQGAPDVVRDLFNKDTPANKPPVPKAQ